MKVDVNGKTVDVPVGISFLEWTRILASGSSPRFLAWKPTRPKTFRDITDPFWKGQYLDLLALVKDKEELVFPTAAVEQWLQYAPDVKMEELERIFVATHKNKTMMGFSAVVAQTLPTIDPDSVSADREIGFLSKELQESELSVRDARARLVKIDRVQPVAGFQRPNLLRTVFRMTVPELDGQTSFEVLDAAVPDSDCPYISAGKFIKTIPGFKPSPLWPAQTHLVQEVVFFKTDSEKRNLKPLKDMYRRFASAAISVDQDGSAVATFDVHQGQRFIDPSAYAARVLKSVSVDPTDKELVEIGRVVSVKLTGVSFVPYVLTDLLMSGALSSHMMQADELNRAHKIKSTVYAQVCGTGQTVSFQERKEEDGSPYVHVRIRARDDAGVAELTAAAGRVLQEYKTREKEILAFYATYDKSAAKDLRAVAAGPATETSEASGAAPEKTERKILKSLAPDIFLPTYSRKCLHMPVILRGVELEQAKKENKPLMEFPIFGESEKRTYACNHPEHQYPGLRENLLPNKAKYPYVPCCYSKNQLTRPNSKWAIYVRGGKPNDKKAAPEGDALQAEPLPEGALIFLRSILGQVTGSRFFSLRSFSGPETVLNAVYMAVFQTPLTAAQQASEREALAADDAAMGSCAQELYSEPKVDWEAWRREMADASQPLDHLKFYRALETRYDCDIYFMDNKGLIHTQAARGRLRYRPRRPTVIIHVRDTIFTPLMMPPADWVRGPVQNGILTFSPIDAITVKFHTAYQEAQPVYVDGKRMEPIRSDWLPCSMQLVDRLGKTRVLVVEPENYPAFTLVTWPLPPLAAPVTSRETGFPRSPAAGSLAFLGTRFTPKSFRKRLGVLREIVGKLNDGTETCLLTDDPDFAVPLSWADGGTPKYDDPVPSRALEGYTGSEKEARVLLEYAKKAISMREGACNPQSIRRFAENGGVTVNLAVASRSDRPSPRFAAPSKFATKNWSVIVRDQQTARKIIYSLRVAFVNKTCDVSEYRQATLVPNFYKTSTDFVQSDKFTVNVWRDDSDEFAQFKKTRKAIVEWERGLAVPWPLPETEVGSSYSVRFTGISRTFLAMNHPTLDSAMYAAWVWSESGYCPGATNGVVPQDVRVPVYACLKGYKPTLIVKGPDGVPRLDPSTFGDVFKSGALIYKAGEGKPLQYVSLLM
ncbi:hypothetical protein [Largemouth bass virus]|nr:hypothetical protein [Mandarin fish ranavirus]WEI29012.1 hypothetical protein [Largemouth bass virus]WHA35579.1 hypothetical protein MSRaV_91L [Micropterus salmoides ranavirus]WHA35684.1 hypothetical protein SCRaV_91L [Siniperca chuatsi ranavirus]